MTSDLVNKASLMRVDSQPDAYVAFWSGNSSDMHVHSMLYIYIIYIYILCYCLRLLWWPQNIQSVLIYRWCVLIHVWCSLFSVGKKVTTTSGMKLVLFMPCLPWKCLTLMQHLILCPSDLVFYCDCIWPKCLGIKVCAMCGNLRW